MTAQSGGSPALRSLVSSLLTSVVATGLAVLINFVTDSPSNGLIWVAVAALTVIAGVLAALTAATPQLSSHGHAPPGGVPGYPPPRPVSGSSRGKAALVGLLVCGVAVAVIIPAAQYAYGWITGNETGVDRLARPVSATAGQLTLAVDKVEVTSHFTRVTMTVTNKYRETVSLPVFGYCQLTAGAITIAGDSFRSKWHDVPPGQSRTGTVVFGEPLDANAKSVTVTFTTVFGVLRGPPSLAVQNVPLKAA